MEGELQALNKKEKIVRGVLIALGSLFLLVLGALGVIYTVRAKPEWFGIARQEASLDEIQSLISEVGKLIELPPGETPTLATVTEAEKVREQPFFQNAENGDKVLIYANAKKAYLYRPSAKKIIEVGVINLSPNQLDTQAPIPTNLPTQAPTSAISPTPKP